MLKKTFYIALTIYIISKSALAGVIVIGLNDSRVVRLQKDVSTIFVSNPKVADYKVLDKSQVVIYGKSLGETSIIVNDKKGNTIYKSTVFIEKSLGKVKRAVLDKYPDLDISIINRGDQVILYGTVSNKEEKDDIYNIVGTLLNKNKIPLKYDNSGSESGDDKFGYKVSKKVLDEFEYQGISNQLKISFPQQVNVKVNVVEVSSSIVNELGVKWSNLLSSEGFPEGGNGQFNIGKGISLDDIRGLITAVNHDNVGQVLAEPNVSVLSGENATILVGGEMPIVQKSQDSFNVQYKEFGVKLDIAAKVINHKNIKLSLSTGVSAIDAEHSYEGIPSFKSRKTKTTLQLADGDSFVLGGLLNSEDRESLEKIPFIGDVPIIGAMFRHTKSERVKTELVIIATVTLVKSISPYDIKVPFMNKTSDLSRFLGINLQRDTKENIKISKILNDGGYSR
ncbi:type II and III secretion system protein family protein [Dongshaea marina]|uniref:type II and III secretion system protein family protein n=1 Tax=Dongshaea marina TaxID=2047966 RepID=UPI000D3EB13E|nr:pilus assembly protein N-terminal domain-containing protein [Dongshaea marina]